MKIIIFFLSLFTIYYSNVYANSLQILDQKIECKSSKFNKQLFKFIKNLKEKTGADFKGLRFSSMAEANITASKYFLDASVKSKREFVWITFNDKSNSDKPWGFSYPHISKRKRTFVQSRIYDVFLELNPHYSPRAMTHTHFDENSCFSLIDLLVTLGKRGKFYLATSNGNISYINSDYLNNELKIHDRRDLFNYISNTSTKSIRTNVMTNIQGIKVANIYNRIDLLEQSCNREKSE